MGFLYGSVIERKLRDQGYSTVSIGGGMDLIRERRNGRNFEWRADPVCWRERWWAKLAMGVQSNQIMGDIKHYVLNDQETGRNTLNAVLDKQAMQETDLLAFQIAIGMAKPAGVMCSYNRVNGDFACENQYVLTDVLKKEWGSRSSCCTSGLRRLRGTVKAALAGLVRSGGRRDPLGLR